MNRPPFAALKTPLALLVVALLFAVIGIVWSTRHATQAEQQLRAQHGALSASQSRLQRSKTEQTLIDTYLPAYQTWATRGFVNTENRLAWLEAVQTANRDSGLYGLDYALTPRTPAPPALAQTLPLGITTMTLKLPLLVETDLPRFLDTLHARAPGVFRVRSCRVSRLSDAPPQAIDRPELNAECELLWFTVAANVGGTK